MMLSSSMVWFVSTLFVVRVGSSPWGLALLRLAYSPSGRQVPRHGLTALGSALECAAVHLGKRDLPSKVTFMDIKGLRQ